MESIVSTVRLFLDSVDFSDSYIVESVILKFGINHVRASHAVIMPQAKASSFAMFEWIVKQLSQDIKSYMTLEHSLQVLGFLLSFADPSAFRFWINSVPSQVVTNHKGNEFSPLSQRVAYGWTHGCTELIKSGGDYPWMSRAPTISHRAESPMSLALYSARAFSRWRVSLHYAGRDPECVIENALQEEGPLYGTGWRQETLRSLFDWSFELPHDLSWCKICESTLMAVLKGYIEIQPMWVSTLEEIKTGTCPEKTSWALNSGSKVQIEPNTSTNGSSHVWVDQEEELSSPFKALTQD